MSIWFLSLLFLGIKKASCESSGLADDVSNQLFVGFSIGAFILIIIFFTPKITVECGRAHYQYPINFINVVVNNISAYADHSKC